MPRPLSPPEKKKSAVVTFRLSDWEKTLMEQLAFDAGLTVTDLVKSKIMSVTPKRHRASPERLALIKGLGELGRIGSNINQIAKALNSGQYVSPADISEGLNELTQLSDRIHKSLGNGH